MEKPARRVKKVAKKSLVNTSKPKVQAKEKVPAIPVDVSTGWREEEELLDYESEHQPCFSPAGDISEPEDRLRTPIPGQANSSSPDYEFGAGTANDAPMAGQKRHPNFPEDEQRRKAPKDDARRISAALPNGGRQ